MKLAKLTIIPVFSVVLLLVGCAGNPPPDMALELPDSEIEAFYQPNQKEVVKSKKITKTRKKAETKESGKATLYLACGKEKHYDDTTRIFSYEEDRICQFAIDGQKYKHISADGVGRLDLEPGEYVIQQIDEKKGHKVLKLEAGDVVYCQGEHIVHLEHVILKARWQKQFPIECQKENALNQVRLKKPVRMERTYK